MKRQSVLSLVVASILLISMLSFPLRVRGQQRPRRFRVDTGVVFLGQDEELRVTVNGRDGNDAITVRFAWTKYVPGGCDSDGVCRHVVQSQGVTAPMTLGPNQAASYGVSGNLIGVQIAVRVGSADVTAVADIINSTNGKVTTHVIMANTEGD